MNRTNKYNGKRLPNVPPRIILCMVKKFSVIILHFSIHGSKERLLDAVNISLVDVVNTQKDDSNKSSSENILMNL
jgi:hypothetical protein